MSGMTASVKRRLSGSGRQVLAEAASAVVEQGETGRGGGAEQCGGAQETASCGAGLRGLALNVGMRRTHVCSVGSPLL